MNSNQSKKHVHIVKPMRLHPHISKIVVGIIHQQINYLMEDKISNVITSFRKSHETQHSLVIMFEKVETSY